MKDRPVVQLDTPWGQVEVHLQDENHVYVVAGHDGNSNPAGIRINRVPYRLSLHLRRAPIGWLPESGGLYYSLSRKDRDCLNDKPSLAAVEQLDQGLVPLVAHWVSRNPKKLAEGQAAYLEEQLGRVDEQIQHAEERLREAQADRAKILALMGREPQPAPVAAEVVAVLDDAWREIVRFPLAQVCKHWAAGALLNAMEKLGCAPPFEVVDAVISGEDEKALAWKRKED